MAKDNRLMSSPVRGGTQLIRDEVLRLAPWRSSHPWAWTLLSAGRDRSETIIERSSQPFGEINFDVKKRRVRGGLSTLPPFHHA